MLLKTLSVSSDSSAFTHSTEERRMLHTVEDMFLEGDNYCSEAERLESKAEMALSLAFYTNAASKFKQITQLNHVTADSLLRAQIRRESCLKKARTMYRRLLVQSAQKSQQTECNNVRSTRKTNQVRTEKRPCSSCSKSCFWLKEGLCSDCDIRATELHRRTARRNVPTRSTVPRDFTRPRVPEQSSYNRRPAVSRPPVSRPLFDSESSSEEEFAPVKSCAICHVNRQNKYSRSRRCC